MKLTTALHPNWVRGRHILRDMLAAARSCPLWLRGNAVSACVKILGNVYSTIFELAGSMEREEQLTEHGRAERRERKGHLLFI
jgi:hypothetical protein